MPQEFTTNLAVSKGGTIIHNVQSITFAGGGVTLTQDPANPRGVDVTIAGGTAGLTGVDFTDGSHSVTAATTLTVSGGTIGGSGTAATLAIPAPGIAGFDFTDGTHSVTAAKTLTVTGGTIGGSGTAATLLIPADEWSAGPVTNLGTNLSLTSGTLDATGGSGGSYVGNPTLGIEIVTNAGTGTIQNTGTIHQPAESQFGLGVYFKTSPVTSPGTAGAYGGHVNFTTPMVTLTSPAGYGRGSQFYLGGYGITNGTITAYNGYVGNGVTQITNLGVPISANLYVQAGNVIGAGTAGNLVLLPGTATGGGVDGYTLITNMGTTAIATGLFDPGTGILHRVP